MAEEPEIVPQLLATFRRCTFARRVFAPYPCLITHEGDAWEPYTGQPFDPDGWKVQEGGWDHEHCDVCNAKITGGMVYWPNVDPAAGRVDLCEACHQRVMTILEAAPDIRPADPNP